MGPISPFTLPETAFWDITFQKSLCVEKTGTAPVSVPTVRWIDRCMPNIVVTEIAYNNRRWASANLRDKRSRRRAIVGETDLACRAASVNSSAIARFFSRCS